MADQNVDQMLENAIHELDDMFNTLTSSEQSSNQQTSPNTLLMNSSKETSQEKFQQANGMHSLTSFSTLTMETDGPPPKSNGAPPSGGAECVPAYDREVPPRFTESVPAYQNNMHSQVSAYLEIKIIHRELHKLL